jgi:hypothetical protein
MADFDFARLDAALYDTATPVGAVKFQKMVKDFMAMARSDLDKFKGKREEVIRFCVLVMSSGATWALASYVVPEFQLPQ